MIEKGNVEIDENFRKIKNKHRVEVGEGTYIFEFTTILCTNRGKVIIGKNCTLHDFCYIDCTNLIKIGNNCRIAAGCKFVDFNKKYWKKGLIRNNGNEKGKVIIGNNCWFGFNCSVLPGTELGDGCVVGAGSVVNKKFPDNSVIAGVPAKIIKKNRKKR